MSFEPDTAGGYLARGSGYALQLSARDATLRVRQADCAAATKRSACEPWVSLRLNLEGAATSVLTGEQPLASRSHYLLGNNPAAWRRDVPHFGRVRARSVYPGVDLVYYGSGQRQVEFDFVVAPGADPRAIRLRAEGARSLRIARNGDLVIRLAGGEVRQHRPIIYQETGGGRRLVEGRYALAGNRISFRIGAFDRSQPLVIDPVLTYSTYLGGAGNDAAVAVAVDFNDHAFITGYTASANFPTVSGLRSTPAGNTDVFVSRLNATGSALIFSTYLGGSGEDRGLAIAMDQNSTPFVTGYTRSTDFPTQAATQSALRGPQDAFVARLSST
ncbi:MAG: SBBP repeat-containing protein, partial [Burkholderiales bacterium]